MPKRREIKWDFNIQILKLTTWNSSLEGRILGDVIQQVQHTSALISKSWAVMILYESNRWTNGKQPLKKFRSSIKALMISRRNNNMSHVTLLFVVRNMDFTNWYMESLASVIVYSYRIDWCIPAGQFIFAEVEHHQSRWSSFSSVSSFVYLMPFPIHLMASPQIRWSLPWERHHNWVRKVDFENRT